jgi:hypothetical protein
MVKTLLKSFIVIPSLVFISKSTLPNTLALSPRVSHINKLKSLHIRQICHLKHTICFIELNSFNSITFNRLVIFILNHVLTNYKEALLMLLLKVFPELSRVNLSFDFRLCQVILLSNSTCHVN